MILGLIVFGAFFESAAEAADIRAYPPPGQMVDVGGYRLHIYCTGSGSPTVVIDGGLGDWSTMWRWVQLDVAKTTRICTYDRAGNGWSDPGPQPRHAEVFATELHALLENAGIQAPFVIVGHSMGGLTAQMFAHDYPAEAAGLVLIDSMSPDQIRHTAADAQPSPEKASGASTLPSLLARVGLIRLLAEPLGFNAPLPDEVAKAHVAFSVTPKAVQVFLDESLGMPASAAQVGAMGTLGAMPLIVLTARLNQLENWQTWQTAFLQLSTNSQQLYAENSGHNIELEHPEDATAAILQMVAQTGG